VIDCEPYICIRVLIDGEREQPVHVTSVAAIDYDELQSKYRRAIWFLQDIAAMSKKVGSETAAHALAQLGEPRSSDGE
jgi:hypothetical protein